MKNELILFTAELFGLICFFRHLLKKEKVPFFAYIVAFGYACLLLGQIYGVVQFATVGYLPKGLHIGLLGIAGGYGFFFSSVYSQMDSLVDGGQKEYRKYRALAFFAAIFVLLAGLIVLFSELLPGRKLIYSILSVQFALTTYYNVKQLLIPDVEFGLLVSIRGYNLLLLLLSCTFTARNLLDAFGRSTGVIITTCMAAVILAVLMPVLERGMRKWKA